MDTPPAPEDHMAIHIGRREVLCTLASAAVTWPLAARAQQPARMRLIGVLVGNAESDEVAQSWLTVFRGARVVSAASETLRPFQTALMRSSLLTTRSLLRIR